MAKHVLLSRLTPSKVFVVTSPPLLLGCALGADELGRSSAVVSAATERAQPRRAPRVCIPCPPPRLPQVVSPANGIELTCERG